VLAGAAALAAPAELITAAREGTQYPDVPNDVTEATAYSWQHDLVYAVYGDAIVGLKAGLTSPQTQKRFNIDHPVVGALPASAAVTDGVVVVTPGLKIEVEVAFALASADGARGTIYPAIELPRLDYGDMSRVAMPDVIASNVAAYRFILGAPGPIVSDLAALHVTLSRDGRVVAEGTGADALGDPRLSSEWTVTKAREIGYQPREGWIVLTGALGPVVDATPGQYTADYGALGSIAFRIETPPPVADTPPETIEGTEASDAPTNTEESTDNALSPAG
jgi:2-keto-4-pentenoate hydratase